MSSCFSKNSWGWILLSGRAELNGFLKLEVAACFLLLVVKSVVQWKTLPSPGRASCHFLNCPPSSKALEVAKNIERFLVLTCFSIKTFCVNNITFPQMGCVHSQAFFGEFSPVHIPLHLELCLLVLYTARCRNRIFFQSTLHACCICAVINRGVYLGEVIPWKNSPHTPQLLEIGREDLAEDGCVLAKALLCLLWFLCLPNKMFLLLICYRIGSWLPPNV